MIQTLKALLVPTTARSVRLYRQEQLGIKVDIAAMTAFTLEKYAVCEGIDKRTPLGISFNPKFTGLFGDAI